MDSFKSIFRNRLVQSLLFWTISFFVVLRVFTRTEELRTIDLIYTGLFHLPLIIGVLANQFFLNRYLNKQKYIIFTFGFFFSLFLVVQFYPITFDFLAPIIFPDYYFVTVYEWYEMLGIGFIYISFTTLLHFAKGWFQQQEDITKLAKLEKENKRSELQALRAQVNPHFLFNSLNTIYNEALKKTDKAPRLILKLSDMLRYVVDKMDQERVALQEEIEYLTHFVELHKERINEPNKVEFQTQGNFSDMEIAPLLLIIFIENCFKHSDLTDKDAVISILLKQEGNELTLHCKNTVYVEDNNHEKSTGMGIQNARRRLELAYENRHALEISRKGNIYETTLKMMIE
ncbi:MAG: histidine kinase [Gracilimonas sp.]|uniref:sensor histidine kinase n=1 Tax=Gracilimonas sp. TaxID=1974203 RepID=UPI0019B1D509|nr:histidine kinase [Gracilimonas sp.]MBD3617093.1 histidine kinase [Gracilimonas sp.]